MRRTSQATVITGTFTPQSAAPIPGEKPRIVIFFSYSQTLTWGKLPQLSQKSAETVPSCCIEVPRPIDYCRDYKLPSVKTFSCNVQNVKVCPGYNVAWKSCTSATFTKNEGPMHFFPLCTRVCPKHERHGGWREPGDFFAQNDANTDQIRF